jgi:hypothetical protein
MEPDSGLIRPNDDDTKCHRLAIAIRKSLAIHSNSRSKLSMKEDSRECMAAIARDENFSD